MQMPHHPTLLTSRAGQLPQEEVKAPLESDSEESEPGPPEYLVLGFNLQPYLPQVFMASTVLGALCCCFLQFPLLHAQQRGLSQVTIVVAGVIASCTFLCMGYAAMADPGQIEVDLEEGGMAPPRSHPCWQYPHPIRRYDHYCKWTNNVVGLYTHRPFILMLLGLSTMGLLGIGLDAYLTVVVKEIVTQLGLLSHLAYCGIMLYIVVPILEIHFGLISRNELGHEWKRKIFYVANNTSLGDNVPAESIEDVDEYNSLFDAGLFFYAKTRNCYDHGAWSNWMTFWFTSRWGPDVLGDF